MTTKHTEYLGALLADLKGDFGNLPEKASSLAGLKVGKCPLVPLESILSNAWPMEKKFTKVFPGGRLSFENMLPEEEVKGGKPDLMDSREFESDWGLIEKLTSGYEEANRYSTYHFAQVYGSRLAASTESLSGDVSLFDRNRLLAAVTNCMNHGEYQKDFLLVKGGVSGIQRFIYHEIQAEQAGEAEAVSKRLRGRSFFVAILGDILAEYLVEQLGLEQANVLFVGGGHFNLLLPSSDAVRDQVDSLIQKINESLMQQFHLQLGVVHGMTLLVPDDLQNIQGAFQRVDDEMESAKQKRFAGYLGASIFNITIPNRNQDSKRDVFVKMGEKIPHADFLIEIAGEKEARKELGTLVTNRGQTWLALSAVDKDIYLVGKENKEDAWAGLEDWWNEARSILETKALNIKLTRLNDTDFLPPEKVALTYHAMPIGYGFRFIGQHAPRYATNEERGKPIGSIMWFEDLAALDREGNKLNYPQLSALRLDVDDMGALFRFGLGDKVQLARTLSLSREMQYFFGGFLNKMAKEHNIYVVYSGGDDAFLIGSWLNVLYFVYNLRQSFARLTGENPEVGLSGGVFTCHPKYPVARLGYDAGEQESIAKKFHVDKVTVKDAIRVFDHTLSGRRYIDMIKFAEDLDEQVTTRGESGKIRRSLLQHFMRVIQSAIAEKEAENRVEELAFATGKAEPGVKQDKEPDHFEFYRNIGRMYALISRKDYSGKSAALLQKLLNETSSFKLFADYVLPLQFILYKTRK